MYYYILESARQKDFEKIEPKVKEILTNFDILGEFNYIEHIADTEEAVKIAIKKGFSTIVAVGGDALANKIAVNLVNSKIAVGILPLEEGLLSTALGLGNWKSACEILAARRILLMDTGIINEKIFVTQILSTSSPEMPPEIRSQSIFSKILGQSVGKSSLTKTPIDINIEDEYQIKSEVTGLVVSNLRPFGKDIESIRQSMIDNNLHLAFSDLVASGDIYHSLNDTQKTLEKNNISLFHPNRVSIHSDQPLFFWSSGEVIARTPAEIEIIPQSLKIIGGRLR
ncbi:MAG: diacylglycerol kinase family protein [Patescibacteria group bacterium]